ncbi:multidrug ABC transporter permease/ATP-binding protein, partial [Enterococcus faecium]
MKLIKQLDWFIKRQKRTYVIAIILLIITGVVDMLPPWIIGQAIDAIRVGSLTTERLILIVSSLLGIMV